MNRCIARVSDSGGGSSRDTTPPANSHAVAPSTTARPRGDRRPAQSPASPPVEAEERDQRQRRRQEAAVLQHHQQPRDRPAAHRQAAVEGQHQHDGERGEREARRRGRAAGGPPLEHRAQRRALADQHRLAVEHVHRARRWPPRRRAEAEISVRNTSSAPASRRNSALMSSVTLTIGTNAVQAFERDRSAARPPPPATPRPCRPASAASGRRGSRGRTTRMVRNSAELVSVTGTQDDQGQQQVGRRRRPACRPAAVATPSATGWRGWPRSDSIDSSQTARNLATTISAGRIGATSSVCIVPRSFSPAVRSMAAYMPPSTDSVSRM